MDKLLSRTTTIDKLFWANSIDRTGNGYGYTTHANNLKAAIEKKGVVFSQDAKIAVHITIPTIFKPIDGHLNVLYTMYECTTIPKKWADAIQLADVLVTPCKQNQQLFRNYTNKPVEMVNEGVNTSLYRFKVREFPKDEPFIFLWVGAPNVRKGFEHVGAAWELWRHKHPELKGKTKLYMKSSNLTLGEIKEHLTDLDILMDGRSLSNDDLAALYHSAHAFLLPSMGEGFGLTLAEAMSTGLPSIFTPWGGTVDFANLDNAFPVMWNFKEVTTMNVDLVTKEQTVEHTSTAASASIKDIVCKMESIYYNYDKALLRGLRAAEDIRAHFTWDDSATSFLNVMEKYQ